MLNHIYYDMISLSGQVMSGQVMVNCNNHDMFCHIGHFGSYKTEWL